MKNKLFTLAAALTLAAVIGGVYAAPALAVVIKAALIKNVDEPGRSPYLMKLQCNAVFGTNFCDVDAPQVPMDKRLVVEHISSSISANDPGPVLAELRSTASPSDLRAVLQIHFFGLLGTYNHGSSDPVRTYFGPGETPRISGRAPTTGGTFITVVITGYLVDLTI